MPRLVVIATVIAATAQGASCAATTAPVQAQPPRLPAIATTTTAPPEREPSAEATRATLQAELLLQQGDIPGAILELRAAIVHDERSPYLRTRLGEALLAVGDAEGADVAADDAVRIAGQPDGDRDALVDALRLKAAARDLLGDADGATRALRRALEVRPGDRRASAMLAELLVQRGELDAAEAVVARWMEAEGGGDGWVALARVFAERGEVDRAFGHLSRALAVRDDDDDALALRRDLLLALGRFPEATTAARALARARGDGPEVRSGVLAALALSDPDEARALAQSWLADDPGESLRLLIADAFERAGLLDDALATLSGVGEGASTLVILERARLQIQLRHADDARALACPLATRGADAIGDEPLADFAVVVCARAEVVAGHPDDAVTRLLSALAARGPAPRLLQALRHAVPHAAAARQAAARQAIEHLLARGVDLGVDEVSGAAFVLDAVGARDAARALLEDQLRRRPGDRDAVLAHARLLEQQATSTSQALAAVELAQRVLERERGAADVDTLNFVAFALAEQHAHGDDPAPRPSTHRAEEARAYAWRAVLLDPLNGYVVDTLGWTELACGDVDAAIATLRRADRLSPDEGEVWFHLAAALAARKDPSARDAVHRARALLRADVSAPARLLSRLDALERGLLP